MARIRRDNLGSRVAHRSLDVGLNWLALTLAYLAKESFDLGAPTQPLSAGVVVHTFTVVALVWLAVGSAMELYVYKRRLFAEIVTLIAALAVTIAFFNTYVYFTRLFIFPRIGMGLYAIFGSSLLIASRALKQAGRRAFFRRGFGVKRAVVVGNGPVAQRLAKAFRRDPALGYRFLGFVSDNPAGLPGDEYLGAIQGLEQLIRDHGVEEVIVALGSNEHQRILQIVHHCQNENLRLRVVPDLYEVIMVRATLTEIDDIPLIGLRDPVITGYQSVVKRVFDLAVGSFCLLLASPLFVLIPLAIWIDSRFRGPVFFSQERVGENGRSFRMYKFRSMVPDAEQRLAELVNIAELPEPVFKILDDPRVTRLGRFLRRTSLDELPQLINVLKGDMSMVGPRPEQVDVVRNYQLWHRKRLCVKPGLTGPMQVSGRGALSLDERINLELMYISQYSLLEDVKYLLKTIPAVCRARGAY